MAELPFDIGLGLQDSHVLVTGSSGAIGAVVVQAFLAAGAVVSGFDKVESTMVAPRFHPLVVDITDEVALAQAFADARSRLGLISTLIAAAGLDLSYAPRHSLVDMPLAEWRRVMNVNVDGTFLTCRTWLREIREFVRHEKNLSAILFGSEAGRFGVPTCAPYAASKSAIQTGLVLSLARDVVSVHPGIRVNAVAPGPVQTAQYRKECAQDQQAMWKEAEATVALRKPVTMQAVARACLFLASDNFSSNITGQLLPIDSGKQGNLFWLPGGNPA